MNPRGLAMLGMCMAGAGCASAIPLPSFTPTGIETAYLSAGRLERDGQCIRLITTDNRYTVIWPQGASLEMGPPERIVLADGATLTIGEDVILRGGEVDAISYPDAAARCGRPLFQTYGLGEPR